MPKRRLKSLQKAGSSPGTNSKVSRETSLKVSPGNNPGSSLKLSPGNQDQETQSKGQPRNNSRLSPGRSVPGISLKVSPGTSQRISSGETRVKKEGSLIPRKRLPGKEWNAWFQATASEAETPEEDLEKGGFVLPGELVGTTEEFKPGAGTTISAGDIYSTATGNVIIDRKARIVSVKPNTLTPNILKVGDIIYGKITDVRESGAMVEIAGIEGKEDREIVNVRLWGYPCVKCEGLLR